MLIMYSRYLPDGKGGYRRQAQVVTQAQEPRGMPGNDPARTQGFGPRHPPGPPRPPGPRPGPVGRPPPCGPPGGGIVALLRGLDTEDFLILAVLLLAMKNDGASGTELLIAAALYLLLGNSPEQGR